MVNKGLKVNRKRLIDSIKQSAKIGATPNGGLYRLALSEEDLQMRNLFKEWMEEENLSVRVDDFGNMYGRREGKEDLPPVVIGSHLDTQPYGGKFDGILGVLASLEVLRTLNERKISTKRPIEVVNFTNEEGARFEPPLLGSGGVAGIFDQDFIYSRKDKNDKSFVEELSKIGYKGEVENRLLELYAFVELHIEQGPILEDEKTTIGIVEGIKGMSWFEIKVSGDGGHAGPTPMHLRRDALFATTEMIQQIEAKSKQFKDLQVTIGKLTLLPNVTNCIPEDLTFSLDVRHQEDEIRKAYIQEAKEALRQIAKKREVELSIKEVWEIETTRFHSHVLSTIEEQAKKLNYSQRRLYSGAGHDSRYIQQMAPTGMIFIPSIGGISHVEEEYSTDEDVEKGANVLLHTVLQLAEEE